MSNCRCTRLFTVGYLICIFWAFFLASFSSIHMSDTMIKCTFAPEKYLLKNKIETIFLFVERKKRNGFDLTMTNWGFHFREILMSGSLYLKICIESNFDLIFFVKISFHFGCNPIFSQRIENSSNSITSSIFANSFCEFIANFRIDG